MKIQKGFQRITGIFLCCFVLMLLVCLPAKAEPAKNEKTKEKNYKIYFCSESGTVYKALTQKAVKGKQIRLPQVPEKRGFQAQGWTLKQGGKKAAFKEKQKIKVTKTIYFYAVRKALPRYTVNYYNENGRLYQRAYYKGEKLVFPSIQNREGYRFLGWSHEPGCSSNPEFLAGSTIRITGNLKVYAVFYDNTKENDLPVTSLESLDSEKYAGIVFVGDSRSVCMKKALRAEGKKHYPGNVYFFAQGGADLSWFDKHHKAQLLGFMNKMNSEKPLAVVFNYGINDLRHIEGMETEPEMVAQRYTEYFEKIAEDLNRYNCRLFYMSVNPINSKMILKPEGRTEKDVRIFNSVMKENLSGIYGYINTCSWLQRTGYTTWNYRIEMDDGLHYTNATSKRIYNYCIKKINMEE